MPRGGPDYQNPDYALAAAIPDVGALIVPMRGVAPIDGLGRIWFMDTFGQGLSAWRTFVTGAGVLACASIQYAQVAPASACLTTGPTPATDSSFMMYPVLPSGSSRQGIELGVMYGTGMPDTTVFLDIVVGANLVKGKFTLFPAAGVLRLFLGVGYVDLPILLAGTGNVYWLTLKLVLDASVPAYVRLIYGPYSMDLSAYAPALVAFNPAVAVHGVNISGAPSDYASQFLYVGHVILTADEP